MARHFPPGRGARTTVRLVLAVTLLGLAGGLLSPALADREDQLEDRRDQIGDRVHDARQELDDSSRQYYRASQALAVAEAGLSDARSELADLQGRLAAAQALDEQMQQRLADAEDRLDSAEADLGDAEQVVDDQQADIEQFAVGSYSNGDPSLLALGTLLAGDSPMDITELMSATDSVLAAQTGDLDRLDAARIMLQLRQERVEELRDDVARKRREAAENLALVHDLTVQARQQAHKVRLLVVDRRAARQRTRAAKEHDRNVLARTERERERVKDQLAALARRQSRRGSTPTTTTTNGNSGGFLSYPIVGGYITSPYGMRMHPILHVYKLHDGTDFGAACGTPVHAAAAGTIVSEYYNSGYGNRIIMNHGIVNGVSLSTSYNHLTSFVANTGQYVQRGQLIGYSGTTGYSTGCHLHFMVYVNGATTDPMGWL